MLHSFLYVVLLGAGRVWMQTRYPKKIERESALQVKYQGSYEKVGKRVLLVLIVLIFLGELLIEL